MDRTSRRGEEIATSSWKKSMKCRRCGSGQQAHSKTTWSYRCGHESSGLGASSSSARRSVLGRSRDVSLAVSMGVFEVVVLSFKLNGAESPVRALERVLACDAEHARTYTKQFPSVVRRGLGQAEAERTADMLRAAGARVEVRPVARDEEEEHASRAPLTPPSPVGPAQLALAPLVITQVAAPVAAPVPSETLAAPVADPGFRLGTLRISLEPKPKEEDTGWRLGTLRIQLTQKPAPPAPAARPAPAAGMPQANRGPVPSRDARQRLRRGRRLAAARARHDCAGSGW